MASEKPETSEQESRDGSRVIDLDKLYMQRSNEDIPGEASGQANRTFTTGWRFAERLYSEDQGIPRVRLPPNRAYPAQPAGTPSAGILLRFAGGGTTFVSHGPLTATEIANAAALNLFLQNQRRIAQALATPLPEWNFMEEQEKAKGNYNSHYSTNGDNNSGGFAT